MIFFNIGTVAGFALSVQAAAVPAISDCTTDSCGELSLVQRGASMLAAASNSAQSPLAQFTGDKQMSFYLYEMPIYEPRFEGSLADCDRKGADFMFLQAIKDSPWRVFDHNVADVMVVPCLFETYRRCTSTNHAEKPPSLLRVRSNPHPEDFEEVPWMKAFDTDTETCLQKVMETKTWQMRNGHNHFWIVADWSLNFGKPLSETTFQNMTLGRIEVIDEKESQIANRQPAVTQNACDVVVPYASDIAYGEDFWTPTGYTDWKARNMIANFRFENRSYVLFCQDDPCEGAVDATPHRRMSLTLAEKLGSMTSIFMERAPLDQFRAELHDAKFCLVIRGDTPSTHAIYDALAANCVPVLVSDRWVEVARPFSRGPHGKLWGEFDYEAFTVTFSEDQWLNDVDAVAEKLQSIIADDAVAEHYYNQMQIGRRELLWSYPNNVVSAHALFAAKNCMVTF